MYWLYLAPILEFSHQNNLTKNNEKTKLPPSKHRTVFSANSSANPALRGNEVSMDTIDLGNRESLVCGVFPNQDDTFTAMTYTKSKTFKTESGARRWLARNTD